jgi:hypothetical protein
MSSERNARSPFQLSSGDVHHLRLKRQPHLPLQLTHILNLNLNLDLNLLEYKSEPHPWQELALKSIDPPNPSPSATWLDLWNLV